MTPWCCPVDGAALTDGERCAACGTRYASTGGVTQLGSAPGSAIDERPIAALDDLATRLRAESPAAAARAFCAQHGCRRAPHGADWKLLLPVTTGARVLEIGPGFGDVTLDLAERGGRVAVLAAHHEAASIVRAHVDARGIPGIAIATIGSLARLPLADAGCDAIALSEAGLRGFGMTRSDWPGLAVELRRIAAPGATVLICQANPLHRLPGIATLRSRLLARREISLDTVLLDALAERSRRGRWGGSAVLRAMAAAGFGAPRIHAPFPDEENTKAILPADDKAVVRYFLDHLVRRNAVSMRAALAILRPLVGLGLFPGIVPYWYFAFSTDSPADSP